MHYYTVLRPKPSWVGLICCTHQHYHRQWLSNTEWSNSTRSASARDRLIWRERQKPRFWIHVVAYEWICISFHPELLIFVLCLWWINTTFLTSLLHRAVPIKITISDALSCEEIYRLYVLYCCAAVSRNNLLHTCHHCSQVLRPMWPTVKRTALIDR